MYRRLQLFLFLLLFAAIGFGQQPPLGKVKVRTPGSFVRACVPLEPPRAFDGGVCPFGLKAPDGTVVPAQWEQVVQAPDGLCRVAELLAIAPAAGAYDVMALTTPLRDQRPQPLPFARALASAPPTIMVDGAPLAITWRQLDHRAGRTCWTRAFSGPHVFGWVTVVDGQNFALVDLVFHVGEPGSDVWTFSRVDVGPGQVVSALPEPRVQGNTLLSCGWMRQRQRREFRIALVESPGDAALALSVLNGAGWGVSDRWTTVDAYGPQQLRIADLSHITGMDSRLRADWQRERDAVVNGWTHGVGATYGQPGGQVGDYNPYGAGYGGITGGSEIFQRSEMELAITGEPQGLLLSQLRHRTYTDRHPVGLYQPNGKPIDPWPKGWRPEITDGAHWQAHTVDPFPVPSRSTPIDGWAAIDYQHGVRRWHDSMALTWLSHDAIAERELELNALLWAGAMRTRIPGFLSSGATWPGHGGSLGRAHGWGNYLIAAAYATGSKAFRDGHVVWIRDVVEAYRRLQMPSGIWQAEFNNKSSQAAPFNNQHAVQQTIELGIGANGLVCLRGSAGSDVDAQVLRAGRDGVWKYLWNGNPNGGGTWQFAAVRPPPFSAEPYLTIPAGMHSTSLDSFQIGSTLAYALMIAPQDPDLRAAVRAYTQGAADPLAWLRQQGPKEITNREPLLGALQRFP